MDLRKVLAELRRELSQLDAAILSLERLKEQGRRRGRPPKLLVELRRSKHENDVERKVPASRSRRRAEGGGGSPHKTT